MFECAGHARGLQTPASPRTSLLGRGVVEHHGRIAPVTIQTPQIEPHRVDLPREPWSLRDMSVIEINLSDLDHNMRVLRRIVGPECGLCPIVKADAYGLGAVRIGKRLAYEGVPMLAVYTPDQAGELLKAAVGSRILVLMPVREIARVDELYRGLIADKVHLTVHDNDHVSDLIGITERFGLTIQVHLEVDTGMSRGGCNVDEAASVLERIAACRRLKLAGVFTHFASADSNLEFTTRQLAAFDKLLARCAEHVPAECRIHAASSFATLRHPRFHKGMVRIGLSWAGYGLEWMQGGEVIAEAAQLRPIVTWKSRIVQVKRIGEGVSVGYGSRWTARRPTTLGLIPVGYADGYPMGLGSRNDQPKGACVAVMDRGRDGAEHGGLLGYAPVVGSVNMDQITIDLTDVVARSGAGLGVGAGTIVELISPDLRAPNHLPALAELAGTIPHEMLTRLNPRIKRVYFAPVGPAPEHVEVVKSAVRMETRHRTTV
jgi:alanine racemase